MYSWLACCNDCVWHVLSCRVCITQAPCLCVHVCAGIAHLMGSLKAEASSKTVGVHTLSPGMVLTDLLLEGATLENKQIFNILCEQVSSLSALSHCCALRPCSVGVCTCACTLWWKELSGTQLCLIACRPVRVLCIMQSLYVSFQDTHQVGRE